MEGRSNLKRKPRLAGLVADFLSERNRKPNDASRALAEFRDIAQKRSWQAYLFGGVPRGFWVQRNQIRDFDIVCSDDCFDEVQNHFESSIVYKNRFGGVKLRLGSVEFDIWSLSSTWAFREGLVSPKTFDSLPLTTFLSVDSLIVEIAPKKGATRKVYEAGFFKTLRTGVIDIVLLENPFPLLCVARTFRLAESLRLRLSRALCHYILQACYKYDVNEFESIQMKHYGRLCYNNDDLCSLLRLLESGLSTNAKAITLFERPAYQMEFL